MTTIDLDALQPPSAPPARTAAAQRLHLAGVALFGDRYHSALAKELKISRPLVHAMVNDQRRISREIELRLAQVIRSRIVPRLEAKIEQLSGLAKDVELKWSSTF